MFRWANNKKSISGKFKVKVEEILANKTVKRSMQQLNLVSSVIVRRGQINIYNINYEQLKKTRQLVVVPHNIKVSSKNGGIMRNILFKRFSCGNFF